VKTGDRKISSKNFFQNVVQPQEGRMKDCCQNLKPYAPLFLRLGLGVVFVYHGHGKIFGEATALGTAWAGDGFPVLVQALVAWGEFLGGLAILAGFMTPAAALGIIIIMTGAIITVHGKNGFNIMNQGYEYNFVLISMCLALISSGPGPFSAGCKRCCKSPDKA
jgi:putative oxidoreductase